MLSISGDSAAADNLEATFDGTGYANGVAPATQDQVSGIGALGGVQNQVASTNTLSTGSVISGTYSNTLAQDGVYHQIEDTAGSLDIYYEFSLGATGGASGVTIIGRVNGGNDDLTLYAWDWDNSTWDTIRSYDGQVSSGDVTRTAILIEDYTGTAGDAGKVRVRFAGTGLTSADLYIDQIYVTYGVLQSATGYDLGAIWVDTVNGEAGSVQGVNGTADNAVLTWADALTLSAALKIKRFVIVNGSTIQLSANSDNYTFLGWEWTLDLNGQSIAGSFFNGAAVTGTGTGSGARFFFCKMGQGGTATLGACGMKDCAIAGDIVLSAAGTYLLDGCFSGIAGTATPSVDFSAGVGNQNLNMRHYSGGVEIKNFGDNGTDNMSLEGFGQVVINANCDAGTLAIRGTFTVTDNASGNVTLSDEARYDQTQILDAVINDATRIDASQLNTHAAVDPATSAAMATAQADLDTITGTDGVTLATAQALYAPAKAGDLMGLANDAITAAKYDESTAFPRSRIRSTPL